MLKVLVVLSVALCVVHAWEAIGIVEEKPEKFKNQEGCYLKDLDMAIPYGPSSPYKSSCSQYLCGEKTYKEIGCGSVLAHPPCYTVADSEKPYPKCCPQIKCPRIFNNK